MVLVVVKGGVKRGFSGTAILFAEVAGTLAHIRVRHCPATRHLPLGVPISSTTWDAGCLNRDEPPFSTLNLSSILPKTFQLRPSSIASIYNIFSAFIACLKAWQLLYSFVQAGYLT